MVFIVTPMVFIITPMVLIVIPMVFIIAPVVIFVLIAPVVIFVLIAPVVIFILIAPMVIFVFIAPVVIFVLIAPVVIFVLIAPVVIFVFIAPVVIFVLTVVLVVIFVVSSFAVATLSACASEIRSFAYLAGNLLSIIRYYICYPVESISQSLVLIYATIATAISSRVNSCDSKVAFIKDKSWSTRVSSPRKTLIVEGIILWTIKSVLKNSVFVVKDAVTGLS